MENQLSFSSIEQSRDCICCKQKDKIIQNYKKLVELHKIRAKKCNTNVLYAIKTARLNSNREVLEEIANQLSRPKKMHSKKVSVSDNTAEGSTIENEQRKWVASSMMEQTGSKWRLTKVSAENEMMSTCPAAIFQSHQAEGPKRISLLSQWHKKFMQMSQTISDKSLKISQLTNKIQQLNSKYLYTRSIFLNLLKSLQIQNRSTNISSQSKDIINLILHLFEYSQQEINNMLGNQTTKVIQIQSAGNKNVFDRRRHSRLSLIR